MIKPDAPHPEFGLQAAHYEMVADFYRGVSAVRDKGTRYLAKTAGMRNASDPHSAEERYKAFVGRATFPGIFRQAVSAIVGVATQKEPQELAIPDEWESLDTLATRDGDGLRGLQARIVREMAIKGRVGVLTDLRSDVDQTPIFVPFMAEQVINWRTALIDGKRQLTLLALKKYEDRPGAEHWDDASVEVVDLYALGRGGVTLRKFEKRPGRAGDEWVEVPAIQPRSARQAGTEATTDEAGRINGFRLREIPFVIGTPHGIGPEPIDPPFLDLVLKLQDIYAGSANYREAQSMYEPTPVVTGMTAEWIDSGYAPSSMGVGVSWLLPQGADAKMLEYSGPTIANIRQCLMDDAADAAKLAMQPFEQLMQGPESGEAKRQRAKVKANVLREIHLSAAKVIEESLRIGARWTGFNPEEIFFTVADDLDDAEMTPEELRETTAAWLSGSLTDPDLYALLKKGGKTKLTFEEWQAEQEGGSIGSAGSEPTFEGAAAQLPPGAEGAFVNG